MRHGAPFTADEDSYLNAYYLEKSCAELAQALKRTISATQSRLRHLGLSKRKAKKQAAGESVAPHQTRVTVLFDDDLMPVIRDTAKSSGMSMSGLICDITRRALLRKRAA